MRIDIRAIAIVIVAAGSIAATGGSASAAAPSAMLVTSHFQTTSIPNPSANVPPHTSFWSTSTNSQGQATGCQSGQIDESTTCILTVLDDIDNARSLEGVPDMSLPSDFTQLTQAQQLLTVVNSERTGRGLSPFVGLTTSYDSVSQTAAADDTDPSFATFPSGVFSWGSIWAGGDPNALVADYEWMYDDGWGGSTQNTSNLACTSPTASGCWGHRDNILTMGSVVGCSTCALVAGAAETTSSGWATSFAMIFVLAEGSAPPLAWTYPTPASPSSTGPTEVSCQPPSPVSGYRMFGRDGATYDYGTMPYCGGVNGMSLDAPIVSGADTPDSGGYWLVASDGGIFAFGDAGYYGSQGGKPLAKPIVGMAVTPDGKGYWLVATDGGIFAFGDAGYYGSEGAAHLNKPIVAMATTPDGNGYYLLASDGGIFTFGDAAYAGSMGGTPLNQPMVGIAVDPHGGYWAVATDGGIFAFGGAPYHGSTGAVRLNKPIIGMSASTDAGGYLLFASDGGVFAFGDAAFCGSAGALDLSAPIITIAA